ncbi:DUF4124 domain-containing protein [Chromatium okenii]|uniref:DUF4124 domain-containing protein n=1 Tax=Chromatium okenii TaxID=61644 RepID=UPI001908EFC9|nr:DUF4124 domain-containing protein [Chromatium okenii]
MRPRRLIPLCTTVLWSASLFTAGLVTAAAEGQLYRWVDDSGVVHYSDRIPPQQIEQGHTTLNREGIRTEVVAPAPTAEDLKRIAEQERLQQEAARRAVQERQTNQELLQRFHSIEDLLLTRDGKIAAIDALNQTTRDRIRQAQQRLRDLHKQRLARQPQDPPLPVSFAADMAQVEQQIRAGYTTIVSQEFQKVAIHADFNQLQARYLALKNNATPGANVASPPTAELANNLVRCTGAAACQRAWQTAQAYVRAQPDIREELTGAGLLIAVQRDDREERLLTLVWIQQPSDPAVSLYLDLECKNRRTASLICTNQAALKARDGFRAALE